MPNVHAHTMRKNIFTQHTIKAMKDSRGQSNRGAVSVMDTRSHWQVCHKLFFEDTSKIHILERTELLNFLTHLGASGRQGARLTSSIALKDLKSRGRELGAQTGGHHNNWLIMLLQKHNIKTRTVQVARQLIKNYLWREQHFDTASKRDLRPLKVQ